MPNSSFSLGSSDTKNRYALDYFINADCQQVSLTIFRSPLFLKSGVKISKPVAGARGFSVFRRIFFSAGSDAAPGSTERLICSAAVGPSRAAISFFSTAHQLTSSTLKPPATTDSQHLRIASGVAACAQYFPARKCGPWTTRKFT